MSNTVGTGSSQVVKQCQVCLKEDLTPFMFLGYMPPVNKMVDIGKQLEEQPAYPAQVLYCQHCHLVQLGLIVDPTILFPAEYPYTSSTTKVLRDNFAELSEQCRKMISQSSDDLIVDIGSNDGNLLDYFKEHMNVQGITPEDIGKLAIEKGIPTHFSYFNEEAVDTVLENRGAAKIITATNVFAHMEDVHSVIKNILKLLKDDGVFISESHYLAPLVETLQYDTVYHEHLRYYSLHSLIHLLEMHDLEVFHACRIPTHGGSIRVYSCRKGERDIQDSVKSILEEEKKIVTSLESLKQFSQQVTKSKVDLLALMKSIKDQDGRIYGIGAPSRGSTLVNYTGLDEGMVESILEIKGSYKIGKYLPGTVIPIEEESKLFNDQPDYAILFSWHIADELMPKLKSLGYKGDFIVPLPEPKIVKNESL